jgi:hypothetical protein
MIKRRIEQRRHSDVIWSVAVSDALCLVRSRLQRTELSLVPGRSAAEGGRITAAGVMNFGYPQAHEDDAERAAQAGLEAMWRDQGKREEASRLCDEAKPGQILISPRVLMAVKEAVTVEPVGEFELKGRRIPRASAWPNSRSSLEKPKMK